MAELETSMGLVYITLPSKQLSELKAVIEDEKERVKDGAPPFLSPFLSFHFFPYPASSFCLLDNAMLNARDAANMRGLPRSMQRVSSLPDLSAPRPRSSPEVERVKGGTPSSKRKRRGSLLGLKDSLFGKGGKEQRSLSRSSSMENASGSPLQGRALVASPVLSRSTSDGPVANRRRSSAEDLMECAANGEGE